MQVIFQSKARAQGIERSRGAGEVTMLRPNQKPIIFRGGTFKTSIREQIQYILHSRLYREGTVLLETDIDQVEQYLLGDLPEKLTEDVLKNVDNEGIIKLASISGVPRDRHNGNASIIKAIIKGKNVTNLMQSVIDQHTIDDGVKEKDDRDLFTKLIDEGVVYKAGPWYKFRKGEDQDSDQDFTLGRKEVEAVEWVDQNKEKAEAKLNGN